MCFVDIYCERFNGTWNVTGTNIEKLNETIEAFQKHGYTKFKFFPPCSCFYIKGNAIGETLKDYLFANELEL